MISEITEVKDDTCEELLIPPETVGEFIDSCIPKGYRQRGTDPVIVVNGDYTGLLVQLEPAL